MRKKKEDKQWEKFLRKVYQERTVSGADIVQEYLLGKTVIIEDGTEIYLNKKSVKNVTISPHSTTMLYDDGMQKPAFILHIKKEVE